MRAAHHCCRITVVDFVPVWWSEVTEDRQNYQAMQLAVTSLEFDQLVELVMVQI